MRERREEEGRETERERGKKQVEKDGDEKRTTGTKSETDRLTVMY